MATKYGRIISAKKIRAMKERGWKVMQVTAGPPGIAVHPDEADVWDHEPYKNVVGYVLIDPDGHQVSPEPREREAQAWDDILR